MIYHCKAYNETQILLVYRFEISFHFHQFFTVHIFTSFSLIFFHYVSISFHFIHLPCKMTELFSSKFCLTTLLTLSEAYFFLCFWYGEWPFCLLMKITFSIKFTWVVCWFIDQIVDTLDGHELFAVKQSNKWLRMY